MEKDKKDNWIQKIENFVSYENLKTVDIKFD